MTAMRILIVSVALTGGFRPAHAAAVIQNLQVEYRSTPLGIDVAQPRFSWQMATTAGERGYEQKAYQIVVKDAPGQVVWDTQRIETATSLGIRYEGRPLAAATRYTWTVSVWDQTGRKLTASSWFETGLMDPSPDGAAWLGTQWIGGGDGDLVLYAPYLAVFDVSYALSIAAGSSRASFVYGANDPRLMDRYKNIYQLQNGRDQSYIKLELDISGVDGTPEGKAKLHVYRAGYKNTDTATKPIHTFEVGADVIHSANKHAEHLVEFSSAFGQITATANYPRQIQAVFRLTF